MGRPVWSDSRIQGLQTPSQELALAKLFGYLSRPGETYAAREGGQWSVYANQTLYAHPRDIGPRHQVPESLFGRLDGHPGRFVWFCIPTIHSEHGANAISRYWVASHHVERRDWVLKDRVPGHQNKRYRRSSVPDQRPTLVAQAPLAKVGLPRTPPSVGATPVRLERHYCKAEKHPVLGWKRPWALCIFWR
jgi:hypothetical protein